MIEAYMFSERSSESILVPEVPHTFVHDLVKWLPIDKERVQYMDLSQNVVAPPPSGLFVGENKFIVGQGKNALDEQFLLTDGLYDCSGLVIRSHKDQYLLAHLLTAHSTHRMFERFKDALGNPSSVKSVSVIPGYHHDSQIDQRIQEMLTEGMRLNPETLFVDIANGKSGEYAGFIQDTVSGDLNGINREFAPPRLMLDKYSTNGARHVLRD